MPPGHFTISSYLVIYIYKIILFSFSFLHKKLTFYSKMTVVSIQCVCIANTRRHEFITIIKVVPVNHVVIRVDVNHC